MQKISRIYLGNCGYKTAWYDGVMLDLRDLDFHAPTDTVINLENGGGKTSLLSLIFSCFETSQDRFLKHIQSRNNHFSQYFANDGTLGLILVEWRMPPRNMLEGSYHLITGQAVAVRNTTEPAEIERLFFSFEEDGNLSLEQVPGPKLCDTPLLALTEFSRWLHDQMRTSPSVYITRKQSDWHRHLEACLIDIEMLRMQVDFSAQEGGFDAGFLNFKSEAEFLRKFFGLTLDAQRASSVREAVATACDKLRRKPQFQRRLVQLQNFSGALSTFATAAQALKQEKVQHIGLTWKGLRLAEALEERAATLEQEATTESTWAATQIAIAATEESSAKSFTQEHATLTNLAFMRKTQQASTALSTLKEDLKSAEADLFHIRAAQLQRAIKAAQREVNELRELSTLKSQELAPYLEKVRKDGSLLRRALHDAAESRRAQIAEIEQATHARSEQAQILQTELSKLKGDLLARSGDKTRLETLQKALLAARQRLVAEGSLTSESEACADALERWNSLKDQLEAEQAALAEQQAELESDAREWRQKADAAKAAAGRIGVDISTRNVFVAEGCAEREYLSQSAALTAAAQADTVTDLESLSLLEQLDQRISSLGLQVTSADIRLAELEADKRSIEETGLAGFSPDVAWVVAKLQANGIRSAQAFNQYLGKAIPDAARARALVQSNPARFLGVCVASTELDACRAVQWGDELPAKPVMVSPTALDQEVMAEALVVPPATDAAYNKAAAQALRQKLVASHDQEKAARHQLEQRRDQALAARSALLAYREKYGAGKLAMAQVRLLQLKQEKTAELQAAGIAEEKEVECATAAKSAVARIKQHETAVNGYRVHISGLKRFMDDHELQQPERLLRLEELERLLGQLQGAILGQEQRLRELQEQDVQAAGNKASMAVEAANLDAERATLTHHDPNLPAQAILKEHPIALEVLRETYQAAAAIYRSNAETRLGTVQAQLESKDKELAAQQNRFTKEFPGVTGPDLDPFRDADLDALLSSKEVLVASLQGKMEPAVVAKAQAEAAHRQWCTSHKVRVCPATAEQEALDDERLDAAIATADASGQFAARKAGEARMAGAAASTRAQEKTATANGLSERKRLLSATLQLDKQPERTLVELKLTAAGQDVKQLQSRFLLEADSSTQVQELVKAFNSISAACTKAEKTARNLFDALKTAAQAPEFVQVEPDLAAQMRSNEFEAAVDDIQRLSGELSDRIAAVESSLSDMAKDFEAAAEELHSLTQVAISSLNTATRKTVPAGAPYVGGKAVLKMRSHLGSISAEDRRRVLHHYLDRLIESGIIPVKGTDLAAEVLLAINARPLGLQVLKMVIEESQQYVAMDKITNSGGEGVVMAMFLYLVITQLRSDMQAKEQKAGGGPLILDNPFAKATTPALWKAQRMLASAMGVQLVFATAVQDYNTLGEFGKFVRLRRAGQNTRTGRWHLETADFQLNESMTEGL